MLPYSSPKAQGDESGEEDLEEGTPDLRYEDTWATALPDGS